MNDATATIGQGDIAFQEKLYHDPNPTRRGLHCARRDWIETQLTARLQPEDIVLEVGIGCGVFTRFLVDQGVAVHAVDINPAFLDGVSELSGVEVKLADATYDQGFRNIDIALCSEVLEHVPPSRSQAMLDQFYAALKPGGMLILSTPQRYATVELMARLFKFKPILALAKMIYGTAEELGHINLLTRKQLQAQIKAAGFAIEEQALFGFYLPVIAEVFGKPGASFLQATGRLFARTPILRGLIWTQAYCLRKPH
jgi:2-polyprenyl-3-methyl-5-hydroxy-6-metoxy-1,4-benzoquinol methylase